MKTLIILFTFLISLLGDPVTMTEVESKNKPPDFKYYYDNGSMTFGMLGYWNDDYGMVYLFTNDELIDSTTFATRKEFIKYITPKDASAKEHILINNITDKKN